MWYTRTMNLLWVVYITFLLLVVELFSLYSPGTLPDYATVSEMFERVTHPWSPGPPDAYRLALRTEVPRLVEAERLAGRWDELTIRHAGNIVIVTRAGSTRYGVSLSVREAVDDYLSDNPHAEPCDAKK